MSITCTWPDYSRLQWSPALSGLVLTPKEPALCKISEMRLLLGANWRGEERLWWGTEQAVAVSSVTSFSELLLPPQQSPVPCAVLLTLTFPRWAGLFWAPSQAPGEFRLSFPQTIPLLPLQQHTHTLLTPSLGAPPSDPALGRCWDLIRPAAS